MSGRFRGALHEPNLPAMSGMVNPSVHAERLTLLPLMQEYVDSFALDIIQVNEDPNSHFFIAPKMQRAILSAVQADQTLLPPENVEAHRALERPKMFGRVLQSFHKRIGLKEAGRYCNRAAYTISEEYWAEILQRQVKLGDETVVTIDTKRKRQKDNPK